MHRDLPRTIRRAHIWKSQGNPEQVLQVLILIFHDMRHIQMHQVAEPVRHSGTRTMYPHPSRSHPLFSRLRRGRGLRQYPQPPELELARTALTIQNTKYKALLDYVITSVSGGECRMRERMITELISSKDQNTTPVTLSDTPFGVRSENQIRHDIKLGAAGELYVRC